MKYKIVFGINNHAVREQYFTVNCHKKLTRLRIILKSLVINQNKQTKDKTSIDYCNLIHPYEECLKCLMYRFEILERIYFNSCCFR